MTRVIMTYGYQIARMYKSICMHKSFLYRYINFHTDIFVFFFVCTKEIKMFSLFLYIIGIVRLCTRYQYTCATKKRRRVRPDFGQVLYV